VQVAPNALYSHVASKTALLDDLLAELLTSVEVPAPDVADPVAGLHALMASAYDILTASPDVVQLYLTRQGTRVPRPRLQRRVTRGTTTGTDGVGDGSSTETTPAAAPRGRDAGRRGLVEVRSPIFVGVVPVAHGRKASMRLRWLVV
jgi:hypothetical protein